jgi:hypothetical protein
MASDQLENLIKVEVSIGYGAGDTAIVLTGGEGAELPDPANGEYNLVWWDSTTYPDPADDPNVEIVRVTALATDTLTVTRAQEGTSATTKNSGGSTYKMFLGPTVKNITDLDHDARINQASHGFSAGEVVYHNGTIYVLANALLPASAESIGFVDNVSSDGDYFTLRTGGRMTGLSGLTAGEAHFLSDTTPGAITATATTTEGSIVKPVLIADSTTSGFIVNMRGSEVTAASTSFYQSFNDSDLNVSDEYPLAHNLGHKYAIIQVYDENDQIMIPDNVTLVDDNNALIDLTSSSPIAGTWRVVVLDVGTDVSLTNRQVTTFTSGSGFYSLGTVTFTHNLNSQYPQIHVYDDSDLKVQPDNITATSTTVSTIDLTSFHPISNTWTMVAQL